MLAWEGEWPWQTQKRKRGRFLLCAESETHNYFDHHIFCESKFFLSSNLDNEVKKNSILTTE